MVIDSQNEIGHSTALKLGLVLAGGGGKGGYQVGACRYIFETLSAMGVCKFHSISGTSIGALNGLLFATGSPEDASATWVEMAGDLRHSTDSEEIIPAAAKLVMFSLIPFIAGLAAVAVYHISHARMSLAIAGVLYALFLVGGLYIIEDLGMIFYILDRNPEKRTLGTERMESVNKIIATVALVSLCVLTTLLSPFGHEPLFKNAWVGFPTFALNVGIWIGLLIYAYILWQPIEAYRRSTTELLTKTGYYDQSSLRQILKRRLSVSIEEWKTDSLFVTVGRKGTYFDPYRNSDLYDAGSPTSPPDGMWVKDEWVPEYYDLRRCNSDESLQHLLVSAAIPIAFPNPRSEDGVRCDGGYVDNVPILPVLTFAKCNLIIVVVLQQEYDRSFDVLTSVLTDLWKKLQITKGGPDSDVDLHNQWRLAEELRHSFSTEELKKQQPVNDLRKCELVYIIPTTKLGTLLDFSLDTFRTSEQLGFNDAQNQLPGQLRDAFKRLGNNLGSSK